jgi:hypothetical protein
MLINIAPIIKKKFVKNIENLLPIKSIIMPAFFKLILPGALIYSFIFIIYYLPKKPPTAYFYLLITNRD